MKTTLFLVGVLALVCSCQVRKKVESPLSKDEMMGIVKELDLQFSTGVQKKDSAFLTSIYSDSAQYVQPNRAIFSGHEEIAKDWGGFLRLKEKPIDLVLNIHDVRGTREVLYETGVGYTLLADSSKWNFNYVNVWRLQSDGAYKLDVDTYTPL